MFLKVKLRDKTNTHTYQRQSREWKVPKKRYNNLFWKVTSEQPSPHNWKQLFPLRRSQSRWQLLQAQGEEWESQQTKLQGFSGPSTYKAKWTVELVRWLLAGRHQWEMRVEQQAGVQSWSSMNAMLNEFGLYSLSGKEPMKVSFLPLAFLWLLTNTDIQCHFISVYPTAHKMVNSVVSRTSTLLAMQVTSIQAGWEKDIIFIEHLLYVKNIGCFYTWKHSSQQSVTVLKWEN